MLTRPCVCCAREASSSFAHALMHGRVADPARREEEVVAIRDLNRELLESSDLRTSLIPVGDGLLLASLR